MNSDEPRQAGFFHVLHRLWQYGRRYRGLFVAAVLASVVLNFANLIRPWLVKDLTDRVLTGTSLAGKGSLLVGLLAAMLGATLVKGLFTYVQGLWLNQASQATVRDLREATFDRLLHLPVSWFDRRAAGDIIARFTDDVRQVTEFLTSGIMVFTNDVIVLVTSLSFMVVKDVQLTILAMSVTPLAGLAVRRYSRRLSSANEEAQETMSDLSSIVHETVSGIKTVKSFNRERAEGDRFRQQNKKAFRQAMRLVQLTATQSPIVEVLATGAIALVMWYCALKIMMGQLTLGDLLAFWAYMLLATTPINRLPQTVAVIMRGCTAAVRMFAILDGAPEPDDGTLEPVLSGQVTLRDVHFRYAEDREDVLRGLDVDVAAGEHVAIVGRNGAGKSTFANLLTRFYTADRGDVMLDGHAVGAMRLQALRRQIGLVAQETLLFSGTVRENIAYGRENATHEEIEAAARAAMSHDMILSLEGGYDYVLNERGANVSGGQRQRIALARMLLSDPKIVILDEATASLDPTTEDALSRSLEAATRGRTVLNIAHRQTITKGAQRVIVLDEGRVVESGTHDELMDRRGVYWDIFQHPDGARP